MVFFVFCPIPQVFFEDIYDLLNEYLILQNLRNWKSLSQIRGQKLNYISARMEIHILSPTNQPLPWSFSEFNFRTKMEYNLL